MTRASYLHSFFRSVASFRRADHGNIAVLFAITLVPIIGFMGAAVDYSLVSRARTTMQNSLDSAALMAAKDAALDGWTASEAVAAGQRYFAALYKTNGSTDVSVSGSYNTSSSNPTLVLNGSASFPTNFMKLVGTPTMSFNQSSTVSWGSSRLRVALVLDNTGSMNDSGKIDALKSATKNLLSQLKGLAVNDGDVYVSIVPFVKDVNLNSSNYNANWIDWTAWDAINGTCSNLNWTDKATCLSKNKIWTPNSHSTWNGCVVDRGDSNAPNSGNYDTNVAAPNSVNAATMYSAEQYAACPQASLGQTYDWTRLNALVDSMAANGNTNQALGLQLGWLSLQGGGPFTAPAMSTGYKYQQFIILLTDGLNTEDRWYTNQASIDARQKLTCNNIKATDITLFTVQVNTGGDPASALLQDCATDPSKFFLLTSSSQILTTFNSIGTSISQLRVKN
ncbi:TadE/TadG family type IV pilus assembly protein [Tardiphaga sp. vice278]|uniref:TadE/TadG family type IV pilus assembly protein n=1 Tax=Tardiphaga sp. vice278 TaxID=2592815 RepID=UPI00143DC434|nr:pilus assembly protein [Tardiphaga sp. vice278]